MFVGIGQVLNASLLRYGEREPAAAFPPEARKNVVGDGTHSTIGASTSAFIASSLVRASPSTATGWDESLYTASRAIGTALAQVYATYTYTDNGLPASVKDAKNNLTTYQYDGHDRLIKTLYPDKVATGVSSLTDYEQYDYDNNDNFVVTRKRNAQVVINNYDDLNRVTSRNYPNPDDNVTLRYDFRDRLTSAYTTGHGLGYLRDNAGRLASVYLNGDLSLAYQYDAAGNRTRITWPEATPFYVTTAYDALNRPTSIKELGTTSLATYAYDDLSRRTTVTLGNSTTTTYGYTTQSALLTLTQWSWS